MKIESLSVKNFKVFGDIKIEGLPNMCVFLGANGSGKTTFFEVFGFLSDSLKNNVSAAINKRGGFKEVISRDKKGNIEFEIKFRNTENDGTLSPLITYQLEIGEKKGKVVIVREILKYRRGNRGQPWHFLNFSFGQGTAIKNEEDYGKEGVKEEREEQQLDSPDILAIKGLGQFQKFKAVSSFRKLLEGWYVSNFQISSAQTVLDTGVSEHLSRSGDNLAQVTKFIHDNHPEIFNTILGKLKERIPGIEKVESVETADGRIILKFQDGSFKDPFIARYVSDGTIKMFAYLILLYDPFPHPLLAIEEPENYLHPDLLIELAEELRIYSNRGSQVFISTHSPDFVNALKIEELFWVKKDKGYSFIVKAKDDKTVEALFNEGDLLGYLWKQNYFKGSGPK
ncbi:MAG: AAA family ATPase [Flammeovirgaceae bacterium]|nr:AAA family ATPase [Flammeovirgaceae bacterium]